MAKSRTGFFVVIDGVDGAGKSSQLKYLAHAFRNAGREVVETLEPGGTETGKLLRHEILHGGYKLTPEQEILLFSADRALHFAQVVIPSLENNKDVLCDRYASSTHAYQGVAGGGDIKLIEDLTLLANKDCNPDLLIVLSLPPEVGFQRKTGDELDRIELQPLSFHSLVHEGYLEYANRHLDFCEVIDAEPIPQIVHNEIIQIVNDRLGLGLSALEI
ncbi:MAG: dTMP kinase [Candidatus Berkelbacteria bacterium]|nr:dTMP kinase [Candidatus Berkelbacteria bacterium]